MAVEGFDLTGKKALVIGPASETSKAIAALGLQPALEAKEHTVEGLIKALEKASAEPGKA